MTGYDQCFVKMGVNKTLVDLSINFLIKMWEKKMTVGLDPENIFVEETRAIWPTKKDNGNPPRFHHIISACGKFMKQILDHFGRFHVTFQKRLIILSCLRHTVYYFTIKMVMKDFYLTIESFSFYSTHLMAVLCQWIIFINSFNYLLTKIGNKLFFKNVNI